MSTNQEVALVSQISKIEKLLRNITKGMRYYFMKLSERNE